ncbi:PTS sugar transporter subunit IIB [Protaetiibacter intestinalis]|uniref:PTS IIB subunit n=1 Tax=Protaetiibacter intestinalis TaxID=2419774 RepID=A0A387B6Z2_9MICO|nr:PTS IIB subunit [Protaetiibacter intestinalis]AYF97541.1 PTS IIB subunit [Protaetiibacter intestinalis]
MRVLIVCGAGASSTFVAQRLRRAAADRAVELEAVASSASAAADLVGGADVVIAGAHLGSTVAELAVLAADARVPFVVLDDAARQDGDELLDTTLAALGSAPRERTR